jgi:hypothetical protein
MDKAIVFGVYEFVGFHLSKKLLERGYEVKGILFDSSGCNVEEKRLEVGRNANLTEKEWENWDGFKFEQEDEKPSLIILSLYDLFMASKEKLLNSETINKWFFLIDNKEGHQYQIVCLLPIQLLAISIGQDGLKELRFFLEKIKEQGKNVQYYYLPSIFGPWQPDTFLFQKFMLNNLNENVVLSESREWRKDAVFVEDAIDTMIEKIESGSIGQFVLKSGKSNRWDECADFLNIDPKFRYIAERGDLILDDQIVQLSVKNVTPISDSLTKQKEHLNYLTCL